MSGSRVTFVGDAMAAVVQGVIEVRDLLGETPVIVGGLAVLSRLSSPYRATVDLDVVDRLLGVTPQLDVLRAAVGSESVEPAAVMLPTRYGAVRVDVLEVRQIELDEPSDDPGDRLHASSHAWASDTATEKLQAVMNRSEDKQGTDLLDIIRLALDTDTRPAVIAQVEAVDDSIASDIALHVDLWLVRRRAQALQRIGNTGASTSLSMISSSLPSSSWLLHVEPTRRSRPLPVSEGGAGGRLLRDDTFAVKKRRCQAPERATCCDVALHRHAGLMKATLLAELAG